MAKYTPSEYEYIAELSYIKTKKNAKVTLREESIRSIVILRDYYAYNMPLLFLNITLDKNLIDDMLQNSADNLLNLKISKIKKSEESTSLLTVPIDYINAQFVYFIIKDVNYNKKLDYGYGENTEREDINQTITIGMLKLDTLNKNKKSFNTVLSNTSMVDAVTNITKTLGPIIIEPFTYNQQLSQLVIKPLTSVVKTIEYLNNINVFYDTPYMFFMDFEMSYLLSSSGKPVPKLGQKINTVLINIMDLETPESQVQGMLTNTKQKNYQLDIASVDTEVYNNKLTEKSYNSINAVTSSGFLKKAELEINRSSYITAKTKFTRIENENKNMVKNIEAKAKSDVMQISVTKNNLDGSVLNPNLEYIVKNYEQYKDRDGRYLLNRKREIFYREDTKFLYSTILDLSFIAPTGAAGTKK